MTTSESELAERLRMLLRGELHVGRLGAGDRLPSIRELARDYGADHRVVAKVYRRLAREGLVEIRHRAGVFVAQRHHAPVPAGAEAWIGTMLCEARARQIPLPVLASLVGRLAGGAIRCALLDETEDQLAACAEELARHFGLHVVPCKLRQRGTTGQLAERERLRQVLDGVDLAVTTSFHISHLDELAGEAGVPLIGISIADLYGEELRRRLRHGKLTVVVADERYQSRAAAYFASAIAEGRLRVLLAHDTAAASLRPSRDVLFTRAASRRLGLPEQHLLGDGQPYFAPATVAAVINAMIHVAAADRAAGDGGADPTAACASTPQQGQRRRAPQDFVRGSG